MPIIAYSAALCGHRQRCAIARSLTHLAFDISLPTEEQSRTVDDIVGRFLLPGTDLKRELGAGRKHIGRAEVDIVCAKYSVSRRCVALRDLDEGIISNDDCLDIAGDSDEYAAATERPMRLTQFACRAFYEGEIGIGKVAELLKVSVFDARKLCGLEIAAEF